MKAFLSHSSRDKEFVKATAKELGRQFCIFDEQAFDSGVEFKNSIEQGLDESSVFVLFASAVSLQSVWVQFEAEEAWYRKLRNQLTRSLVYIIDSTVQIKDLPEWLARALVRRENSPKTLARDIRHHLNELLRQRQGPYFVGRGPDVERVERALTPIDGSPPPHALFVTGLPGIGRRSLVRHTAPTSLNLRKQVEIRVGEGDSINDICIAVADLAEPYSTKEGFDRLVAGIRQLSEAESLERLMTNLRAMVAAGELPILHDEGGLLDSEGDIRTAVQTIIAALAPNDDAYIVFTSHRRPHTPIGTSLPTIHLEPLKTEDTKRLILLLAARSGLELSIGEVAEIAEYVAGYPPAAQFAIHQASNYGIDLVLRDKSTLTQFRTGFFIRHLAKIALSGEDQKILRLLAAHSPLPLPVIASASHIELRKLNALLVRLLDLALITAGEDGYYRIADPVGDAVLNAFGFLDEEQHKGVGLGLSKFLAETETDAPRLELSRVLFRAACFANDDQLAEGATYFAGDLIKLTATLYHSRRYDQVVQVADTALNQRPDSVTARGFLIRALIQQERWDDAQREISVLQKFAPQREVSFLTGFLERKRQRFKQAIEAYKQAVRLGWKGAAASRELGLCYFLSRDYVNAAIYIKEALQRHSDNRFVVDLWAQIATHQGDETAARSALARMELIDRPLHYLHRRSRVESAFGHLPEARAAAAEAVACEVSPPFEALAQLAYCDIQLNQLREAEEVLGRLDRDFANIKRDIRLGLHCRLEIAQGRYGAALARSERIQDKTTTFHKMIRRDALAGELQSSALKDTTRSTYQLELAELERSLIDVAPNQLLPAELDTLAH